jgi:MerR family transcriptional regulator, glutamine synthetase repressor
VESSIPVYAMGVAERLTGLTARQIRYWERHGLLAPSRTKGRQRLYSEADILRLKEVKRLLGEGMTLERVRAYLAARDAKKPRDDSGRMAERGAAPQVQSLYHATNRDQLLRLIDKDKF